MFYPIMLDIKDHTCLVVGGGQVAARKIKELVRCGAKVKVVSPALCNELAQSHGNGTIEWVQDTYSGQYLGLVTLCFACTDNGEINLRIAEDAAARHIPVCMANAVMNLEKQSLYKFITPSVRRKGDITMAVSCDENPAASRYIAGFLEGCIGDWLQDYIEATRHLRLECHKRIPEPGVRQDFMKSLFSAEMIELAQKDTDQAIKCAAEQLDALCHGRKCNESVD